MTNHNIDWDSAQCLTIFNDLLWKTGALTQNKRTVLTTYLSTTNTTSKRPT